MNKMLFLSQQTKQILRVCHLRNQADTLAHAQIAGGIKNEAQSGVVLQSEADRVEHGDLRIVHTPYFLSGSLALDDLPHLGDGKVCRHVLDFTFHA